MIPYFFMEVECIENTQIIQMEVTGITQRTIGLWCQIDGEEFVNFCGLLRKQELYLHILKWLFKIFDPIVKRPTALGLVFEGRSRQFHTMPKKRKLPSWFQSKKGKNGRQQFTSGFFSCSVRKKADIVVFVQDIFLHDLQFSHSLGSVKHSHFISKAKDVLTIKHFSLDCSVLPNINISIAKKGKKWRDHKLLIFWIETEI